MAIARDRLDEIQMDLITHLCRLPFRRLLPAELQELGGYLFLEGGIFAQRLGAALQTGLFPEVGEDGREILDLAGEADAWFEIRHMLLKMAEQAQESFVAARSEAIRRGLRAVKQIRAIDTLPYPVPRPYGDKVAREIALAPALNKLEAHHQTTRKKKRKAQKGPMTPRRRKSLAQKRELRLARARRAVEGQGE